MITEHLTAATFTAGHAEAALEEHRRGLDGPHTHLARRWAHLLPNGGTPAERAHTLRAAALLNESTQYGLPVSLIGEEENGVLALGHDRRAIAACLAHARWCRYEPPVDGTVHLKWAIFRSTDPAQDEGEGPWIAVWQDPGTPGAVPVTLLEISA